VPENIDGDWKEFLEGLIRRVEGWTSLIVKEPTYPQSEDGLEDFIAKARDYYSLGLRSHQSRTDYIRILRKAEMLSDDDEEALRAAVGELGLSDAFRDSNY
jgi:hypothetical protein